MFLNEPHKLKVGTCFSLNDRNLNDGILTVISMQRVPPNDARIESISAASPRSGS